MIQTYALTAFHAHLKIVAPLRMLLAFGMNFCLSTRIELNVAHPAVMLKARIALIRPEKGK